MVRISAAGFTLIAAIAGTSCATRPSAPAAVAPVGVQAGVTGAIEQWRQAYEVRSMEALARRYAQEPGLAVVQDGALTLGWAAFEPVLRARLERASALRVRLANLHVTALGEGGASAVAAMTRESTVGPTTATEQGVITLVLRKSDAGWVIAAEHYSYKRP